jgi:hypothetical protein
MCPACLSVVAFSSTGHPSCVSVSSYGTPLHTGTDCCWHGPRPLALDILIYTPSEGTCATIQPVADIIRPPYSPTLLSFTKHTGACKRTSRLPCVHSWAVIRSQPTKSSQQLPNRVSMYHCSPSFCSCDTILTNNERHSNQNAM